MGSKQLKRNKITSRNIKKRNKTLKTNNKEDKKEGTNLQENFSNIVFEHENIEEDNSENIPNFLFRSMKPVEEDFLIFYPTVEGI